nr:MAG TPA: hypothetical protein [Caudoviricetes sp.]
MCLCCISSEMRERIGCRRSFFMHFFHIHPSHP